MGDAEDLDPKDGSQPLKKAKSKETEECIDDHGDHLQEGVGVKWQLRKANVRERLEYLRNSCSLTDCVLLVGQGEIIETVNTHEMILCMSSPIFGEILVGHKQDEPIQIPNIEPRIFHLMLDYMYLDKVVLKSAEDACMLYTAAVQYEMPFLCEIAAKFIVKDMTLDNVWPVLKLVNEAPEPILKEECGKFVRKHPAAFLRHDNFPKVDQNVVAMLVNLDCLDIPELELLIAVNKWSEERCLEVSIPADTQNKRAIIGPEILMKLRFLALSQEEFVREVAFMPENSSSCILSLEESYSILMNLTHFGSYPMPLGFCSDKRQRKLSRLRCVRKILQGLTHPSVTFGGFSTPPPTIFGFPYSTPDQVVALASPTQTATFGGRNFSLDVKVDHNIMLHGIQVPSLWFPVQQGLIPSPKDYDESFIVSIIEPSGSSVNHTLLSGKVRYGSTVDILLKDSIMLQKDALYQLQVYTSNTYFLCKKLNTIEDCPPVKFIFKDKAKVGTVPSLFGGSSGVKMADTDLGFITQLIYSLCG